MILKPGFPYHIYNRGNNRQRIFFKPGNYPYFLQKLKTAFSGKCDILAYCLMPNHFHILVYIPEQFDPQVFYHSYRTLLSSYTRAINIQEGRVGSLFQQNSKFKLVSDRYTFDYTEMCFYYIHANPLKSNLVTLAEDWAYSSLREYLLPSDNAICNLSLARQLIPIPDVPEMLLQRTAQNTPRDVIENILYGGTT